MTVPTVLTAGTKRTDHSVIEVLAKDDKEINAFLHDKYAECKGQTMALITNRVTKWEKKLSKGSGSCNPQSNLEKGIRKPGLYLVSPHRAKGLEFDVVVVDYDEPLNEDYEAEKSLRYVHFTRARNELIVLYNPDKTPRLLEEVYSEYLED